MEGVWDDWGLQAKRAVDSGESGGCGEGAQIGQSDAAGEVDDKISKDVWYLVGWSAAAARTHVCILSLPPVLPLPAVCPPTPSQLPLPDLHYVCTGQIQAKES